MIGDFFVTFYLLLFISANYLDNWKCISVLKGDGTAASQSERGQLSSSIGSSAGTSNGSVNARYYQLGSIQQKNQVPWH